MILGFILGVVGTLCLAAFIIIQISEAVRKNW